MPVILEQERLAYYPMHKCANSTVKHMLYQVETGTRFTGADDGHLSDVGVHQHYSNATTRFRRMPEETAKTYFKFAVVRDPISRFISAFKWLVHAQLVYTRKRTAERLSEQGLPTRPVFTVFLDNLTAYLEARQIARTHLAPLRRFLGRDSSYYDAVYKVSDLKRLAADLSDKCGRKIAVVAANTTQHVAVDVRPTAKQEKKIRDLYASDYEDFGTVL